MRMKKTAIGLALSLMILSTGTALAEEPENSPAQSAEINMLGIYNQAPQDGNGEEETQREQENSQSVTVLGMSNGADQSGIPVMGGIINLYTYLNNSHDRVHSQVYSQGDGYMGVKTAVVNESENANTADYVNGIFYGTGTYMAWNDNGVEWLGRTTSDIEVGMSDDGYPTREGKIYGTYTSDDASAMSITSISGFAQERKTLGSLNYILDGQHTIQGDFIGSGDFLDADNRVSTYSASLVDGAGRYLISIDYLVNNNSVDVAYIIEDREYVDTKIERFSYTSDEPNIIKDVDMIARGLFGTGQPSWSE